ncbi:MAG TPA: TrkH family potassium uptake protein [Vicinamibacterales bacterium]|nr:TrkH family potassium uptake protein [Vicinamibacterales bacterium]
MRLKIVVHVTGTLVRLFSPALLAPLAVALLYAEWRDAIGFLVTFAVTALAGEALRRLCREAAGGVDRLRRVEGLAIVSATWMALAHLAAIPYMVAGLGFIDSLFESMSGLTTTGATVFTDYTLFGRGIFFWRAMTQWLGGVGVIALFIAVLPRLAIAGRELFFAEAAGPSDEKLTPQLRQTAIALWRVYIVLTAAQVAALVLAGMPLFDAICHAFTTLSAGGFSPHPLSIAGYQSAAIDWIVIVFMFIAGANFGLQYRAVRGGRRALVQDEELRAYAGVLAVAAIVLAWVLWAEGMASLEAVRHGTFQVLTILTTTGYASVDFQLWSDQARMVLFVLMFIGGCAGSAAGGPKVVRHILMARFTLRELERTVHPRAVLPVKLGGRVVPEHILRDIQVFMLFYLLTFAVGAAIVVGLGADLLTGITASIACLGNIGPGFGAIGPMASYADLHPASKVVLTLEMWIGRLEVMTVLVLFRFEAWRASRWAAS